MCTCTIHVDLMIVIVKEMLIAIMEIVCLTAKIIMLVDTLAQEEWAMKIFRPRMEQLHSPVVDQASNNQSVYFTMKEVFFQ